MIVKTLEQLVKEIDVQFFKENGYYPGVTSLAVVVAKEIRKLTLEEVANKAEVTIVDWENSRDPIYGVDSDSILKLDLNIIQTW